MCLVQLSKYGKYCLIRKVAQNTSEYGNVSRIRLLFNNLAAGASIHPKLVTTFVQFVHYQQLILEHYKMFHNSHHITAIVSVSNIFGLHPHFWLCLQYFCFGAGNGEFGLSL